MFGQFSDELLLRTIFGQRSVKFSDIGRTRKDLFLETGTTTIYTRSFAAKSEESGL